MLTHKLFGPHKETEIKGNIKIIKPYHTFEECEDDDYGQKYNHFNMKEKIYRKSFQTKGYWKYLS